MIRVNNLDPARMSNVMNAKSFNSRLGDSIMSVRGDCGLTRMIELTPKRSVGNIKQNILEESPNQFDSTLVK